MWFDNWKLKHLNDFFLKKEESQRILCEGQHQYKKPDKLPKALRDALALKLSKHFAQIEQILPDQKAKQDFIEGLIEFAELPLEDYEQYENKNKSRTITTFLVLYCGKEFLETNDNRKFILKEIPKTFSNMILEFMAKNYLQIQDAVTYQENFKGIWLKYLVDIANGIKLPTNLEAKYIATALIAYMGKEATET